MRTEGDDLAEVLLHSMSTRQTITAKIGRRGEEWRGRERRGERRRGEERRGEEGRGEGRREEEGRGEGRGERGGEERSGEGRRGEERGRGERAYWGWGCSYHSHFL